MKVAWLMHHGLSLSVVTHGNQCAGGLTLLASFVVVAGAVTGSLGNVGGEDTGEGTGNDAGDGTGDSDGDVTGEVTGEMWDLKRSEMDYQR